MTYNEMWRKLAQEYDEGEAKAVARMVYEVRYGLTLSDIYIGKDTQLSLDCQTELEEITKRLIEHEPVQYILGQADFCGRTFHVEPGILIPRPETEHLCRLITKHAAIGFPNRTILDIGTGSGCIAITLALDIPNSHCLGHLAHRPACSKRQRPTIRCRRHLPRGRRPHRTRLPLPLEGDGGRLGPHRQQSALYL